MLWDAPRVTSFPPFSFVSFLSHQYPPSITPSSSPPSTLLLQNKKKQQYLLPTTTDQLRATHHYHHPPPPSSIIDHETRRIHSLCPVGLRWTAHHGVCSIESAHNIIILGRP
eukprot:scaffold18778_cov154-Amphora_coffeaeformis.AAC.9